MVLKMIVVLLFTSIKIDNIEEPGSLPSPLTSLSPPPTSAPPFLTSGVFSGGERGREPSQL
jgi:hypothetical protein